VGDIIDETEGSTTSRKRASATVFGFWVRSYFAVCKRGFGFYRVGLTRVIF
jgi:hypothetical protein